MLPCCLPGETLATVPSQRRGKLSRFERAVFSVRGAGVPRAAGRGISGGSSVAMKGMRSSGNFGTWLSAPHCQNFSGAVLSVELSRNRGRGSDGMSGRVPFRPGPFVFLVTKLMLGNATVFEALLRRCGSRTSAPLRCRRWEAELPRQLRSQAGAWERVAKTLSFRTEFRHGRRRGRNEVKSRVRETAPGWRRAAQS
jgi:hypothetical protein